MKLRNKKTGEVVETDKIGLVWNKYGMPAEIGQYDSIAELNADWEDAEGTKVLDIPLIKVKKIREVIRLWAKVNGVRELTYDESDDSLNDIFLNTICFNSLLGLEDGCSYTIAELCGEEEE